MTGNSGQRRRNQQAIKPWPIIAILATLVAALPAGSTDLVRRNAFTITGIESPFVPVPRAPEIGGGAIQAVGSLELLDLRLFSIPQVSGFTVVAAIDLVTGMVISAANSIGIQDPALEDLDLAIRESICSAGGLMLSAVDVAGSWLDPDSMPGRVTHEIRAWGQVYLDTIERAPSHRDLGNPLSMRVDPECVSVIRTRTTAKFVRL